ncbi:A/B/D/E cyclin [Metschnikowia bicuspidata var. bicuspidata NRRL YB-4993]|uniref:A/B/D/E cyclin n=1 Tax=Metschnikowia bicuspidata var. bicuspidata NRRL YB-4993 TaxID=869754 RepID=A0A1A0H9J2_9ASCO|nr:A/B/D/E cyclin [Metschnikowia bicuspidata var. bicuspidata NRRL YB-4993]OBA20794.1 A/B/D/E cyclin [Metschnikowia bicuspidata var. bicuspidata NRRL YB-4993]
MPAAKPLDDDATAPAPSRPHLRDVSRKFGIARPAAAVAPRKRPLGADPAPLQPAAADVGRAAKLVKLDPASQEPLRMPQKRQATMSSTALVEKLHIASDDEPHAKHKKCKTTDYEWEDLDKEDDDDPLMVSEYVDDIFPYLHELEKKTLPDPGYLYKQTQLKPKMRLILVDWLVEMHQRFRLLPETLFLAINIMDRFMSVEVVQIDKLQLLATGSLFIAAKYEEVFSPSVKNYAYYTDGSYTEAAILEAENYILTVLSYDLNYPNPMNFLRRISKADDYDVDLRTLGKYLLEISLVDHNFIGILPSLCSAAAMYIARIILNKHHAWNGNLIHYSGGYKVDDLRDCVALIVRYLDAPIEHDEFQKKYASRKFLRASVVCRTWARKIVSEGRDLFDPALHTEKSS